MIGQDKLKELCEAWNEYPDYVPALTVLVGKRGSGKKTAVEYIRKNVKNDGMLKCENNSVETVRNVIAKCYELGGQIYYVFQDCDNMSTQAKNAMLKVMEEPPKGARFILTVTNSSNLLGTIRSRAFIYEMRPYSLQDMKAFIKRSNDEKIASVNWDEYKFVTCPGDIMRLISLPYDFKDMVQYAQTMVDYIGQATQANALKIATKLDLKGDDENKYPLDLFLNAARVGFLACKDGNGFKAVERITAAIQELNMATVSKQNVIDTLLLDLRRIMRGEEL